MRRIRPAADGILASPIVIGTVTILVVIVAVYLSYIAENGLPFVPTYNVSVEVTNADELIKNADVRVGGARVGQVLTITPEPASRTTPHPFARLGLALDRSLGPLPVDTSYRIRLASVLGGKYVEIVPGHAKRRVPDGGRFTVGHELPFVDLDTAFATFGPRFQSGFRATVGGLGDVLAGRGAQLNDATRSLRQLIGPLQSLLGLLAAPGTRLSGFISGAAATTGALATVAPTINVLLADSATTFEALRSSALGPTLDQLPGTEAIATTVLSNSRPVLADAAAIVEGLRPGAALLPLAAQRTDQIVTGATPLWRRVPRLAAELQTALGAVQALARDPASTQTFQVLGSNDLATFGSSAIGGLGAILRAIAPAQLACNVAGLWARNFAAGLSEGDSTGSWLRFLPVFDAAEGFQASTPARDLHLNYYPIEGGAQCQAGNEPYAPGQLIGNPSRTSNVVDNTTPPPGVLERGRRAGLVP
jgi:virulence factor Mce-like protein